MEIDQESDELSNFLWNLASIHVDKPRNTAVIVSHLTLFARIFTIYSFHRVFWHYTTLLKPFLCFQRCAENSCPRFQSVLVHLSQSLRGQSIPLIRLECVVIFGHSLLNTTPSQWLVYISPASLLFFLRLLFSERYRRSEADIPYETAACSFPRVGCLIILR